MDRRQLLEKLLLIEEPINDILLQLSEIGWDSENELIALTRGHLLMVLEKYLTNKLTGNTLVEWANAIECREDISRENAFENVINEIIYELANPDLTEDLSYEKAYEWYSKLLDKRPCEKKKRGNLGEQN